MIQELNKLHELLNSVQENLTNVIDNQIQTHEILKEYYIKLLNYAQDSENQKRLDTLEKDLMSSQEHINNIRKQLDNVIALSRKD